MAAQPEINPVLTQSLAGLGRLYVVATPVGNLEDITLRALRVLKEAHVIAAEDTRHSLKLLTHFGIRKPMISYWGEREKAKAEEVIAHLRAGKDVALITDAGTPGISDPGAVVISQVLAMGGQVETIPGPSACVTALCVSGLETSQFTFIGFLPAKSGPRKRALEAVLLEPRTLVFYESPHRLIESLIDMEEVLGPQRRAVVAKELTKLHERFYRGTLGEVLDELEHDEDAVAGEYVIMIEGRPEVEKGELSINEAVAEVAALMKKGQGRKEASSTVAKQYGISKKTLYDASLEAQE